jgi:hypothetical protein
MENNTKLIIGGIAVAGLGYYLYKKGFFAKKPSVAETAQTTTSTTPVVKTTPVAKVVTPLYPSGYGENDYVRNPSGDGTVFMLHKGQKLPITYAWWMANAKNDWGKVKDISAPLLMDIPTGNVLDA